MGIIGIMCLAVACLRVGGVTLMVNFGSGVWGSISDKFGVHKFILMLTCLAQTLTVISMFFVGYYYKGILVD
jgi:hypothetical protein